MKAVEQHELNSLLRKAVFLPKKKTTDFLSEEQLKNPQTADRFSKTQKWAVLSETNRH